MRPHFQNDGGWVEPGYEAEAGFEAGYEAGFEPSLRLGSRLGFKAGFEASSSLDVTTLLVQ